MYNGYLSPAYVSYDYEGVDVDEVPLTGSCELSLDLCSIEGCTSSNLSSSYPFSGVSFSIFNPLSYSLSNAFRLLYYYFLTVFDIIVL